MSYKTKDNPYTPGSWDWIQYENKKAWERKQEEQKKKEAAQKAARESLTAMGNSPGKMQDSVYQEGSWDGIQEQNKRAHQDKIKREQRAAAQKAARESMAAIGNENEKMQDSVYQEGSWDWIQEQNRRAFQRNLDSATRNAYSNQSEILSDIKDALHNKDFKAMNTKIKDFFKENPKHAAYIPYDDTYQLVLMDNQIYVMGNGVQKAFDNVNEAIYYIRENDLSHITNIVTEINNLGYNPHDVYHQEYESNKAKEQEYRSKVDELEQQGAEIIGYHYDNDYKIVRYNNRIYVIGHGIRHEVPDVTAAVSYINDQKAQYLDFYKTIDGSQTPEKDTTVEIIYDIVNDMQAIGYQPVDPADPNYESNKNKEREFNLNIYKLKQLGAEIIGNTYGDYKIIRYNNRIYVMGRGVNKQVPDMISALKYINERKSASLPDEKALNVFEVINDIQEMDYTPDGVKDNERKFNAKIEELKQLGAEIIGNMHGTAYKIVRYNNRIYVMGDEIMKEFPDTIAALKYINQLSSYYPEKINGYSVSYEEDGKFHVSGDGIDAAFDTPNDARRYANTLISLPENPTKTDLFNYASENADRYTKISQAEGKSFSDVFWDNKTDWIHPIPKGWDYEEIGIGRSLGADRTKDGKVRHHAGIDFRVSHDTPVIAMTSGVVIDIRRNFYPGTDAVDVLNDDGTIIRYCEIRPGVSIGDRIEQGEYVGTIIQNTDPKSRKWMLHLEIYAGDELGPLRNDTPVNYKHVDQKIYRRRADLVDPYRAQYLPRIYGNF